MPSLHWIWKDKVINHHLKVPYRLLKKGYSFGEENSGNKIIRWDNLEALKALLPEYEGKIKCIYIDPPYNTGNEGWVYNDNVTDPKIKKWLWDVVGKEGEDLTRHDKWLCMMYPRLKLLHRLLADDGAIFVSIDDNEQANLKLLMDEIFGGNNFISNVIWEKAFSPVNLKKHFSENHDFIVCYAKNKEKLTCNGLARTVQSDDRYKNPDNDPRGVWMSSDMTVGPVVSEKLYEIKTPNGKIVKPANWRCWLYTRDRFEEMIRDNRIWFGKTGDNMPRVKKFLSEVKDGMTPMTIWKYSEVGHSQDAAQKLKEIFDWKAIFDYPKSVDLIARCFELYSDKNSIILDSFAGSGTTAHAVFNLNKQDGGNRKFILVEMEEYAETITAERVKRVINWYWDKEGTGGGFEFFDLGPALLTNDGLLADEATEDEIRAYICYTETAFPLPASRLVDHKYWLTRTEDRDHYFYYERENMTILDRAFLGTITEKMPYYTIWADQCHLSDSVMKKHGITFRKIPRDIRNI